MPPRTAKKAAAPPPSSMSALRDKLGRRYGDRVVRRDAVKRYDVIPTGSLSLDLALRTGGWVRGRMHEVIGPEGVGKSTRVLESMVEAQRKFPDLAVQYIDMEQTFDYDWAEALGLDTSDGRFLHLYPDDSEDVSDMLREAARTELFSLVVVDSIGGMESKEAFTKEAAEKVVGRNAQVITRLVKECAVLCRRNDLTALLVNQYRANIGAQMVTDVSAGPKSLRYSTTTKVEMAHAAGDPIRYLIPGDTEDTIIGRMIRARVTRSKVSVQGKKAEYYLINYDTPEYGPVGTDRIDEAVTIGLYTEVIEQGGGGYYTIPSASAKEGTSRIRGKDKLIAHLRSCPDDALLIRDKAVAALSHEVKEETETTFEHEVESA